MDYNTFFINDNNVECITDQLYGRYLVVLYELLILGKKRNKSR